MQSIFRKQVWRQFGGSIYAGITITLPSGFKRFKGTECAGATLDYTYLKQADEYASDQVASINYNNFNGYKKVSCRLGDPISIIGSYTGTLIIGKSNRGNYTTPTKTYDLSQIVTKAPNITDMTIWGATGVSDISSLSPLSLAKLEIQYSSLYGLKSKTTDFEAMAKSLTNLKISNCSSFNDLDGLDKLNNITTLDLSNNRSLGNMQMITKDEVKEAKDTCQYIVDSLPHLTKVILTGCELNNFEALKTAGFKETSSGVFTK